MVPGYPRLHNRLTLPRPARLVAPLGRCLVVRAEPELAHPELAWLAGRLLPGQLMVEAAVLCPLQTKRPYVAFGAAE